jgi:hypothetical protein
VASIGVEIGVEAMARSARSRDSLSSEKRRVALHQCIESAICRTPGAQCSATLLLPTFFPDWTISAGIKITSPAVREAGSPLSCLY